MGLWNLRDGEESAVSNSVVPGLRDCHKTPLCSVLPCESHGCVPMVSLKGRSSYRWANNESDYGAICRVPHNSSSVHGHLWELGGTLLIIMPGQQARTRTAPGKPNHTVTAEMMGDSKTFSQGSQTISLMLDPILLLSRALLSNGSRMWTIDLILNLLVAML